MALRNTINFNQYRGHRRVSGPAVEPVTKAELKSQLRLVAGDTSEDDLLDPYIQSAREACEELFGLALITQTWALTLDHWPNAKEPWWDGVKQMAIGELSASVRTLEVHLPRYPLQAVDTLTVEGDSFTVGDLFIIDTQQQPGRMTLKFGQTAPVIETATANAIQIEYTAGYGDASTDVPADLRLAILQLAASMYTHRGDECSVQDAMKMSGAYTVFSRYKAAGL
jgi:hypothetical protein